MENIETVNVTMPVPKEAKEVVDALSNLAGDIMAKKAIAEITANNLPKLMTAVDGYEQILPSLKSQYRDELAGYFVQQVMAKLMPYEAPAAPVEGEGAGE